MLIFSNKNIAKKAQLNKIEIDFESEKKGRNCKFQSHHKITQAIFTV